MKLPELKNSLKNLAILLVVITGYNALLKAQDPKLGMVCVLSKPHPPEIYSIFYNKPLFTPGFSMKLTNQNEIQLHLPAYTRHSRFRKPVLGRDFTMDISPEFRAKSSFVSRMMYNTGQRFKFVST